MIIIGYQGIGKTTLTKKDMKYIDLESSCTWVNGERSKDWYVVYCNFAEDLSRQGYTVFTSSHEVVRNQLKKSSEEVYVCCPIPELKDEWIERLQRRYDRTGLEKDYKALMNAVNCYETNIKELLESGFPVLKIESATSSIEDVLPKCS